MTSLQNKVLWPMLLQVVIFWLAWEICKTDPLLAVLIVSGFVALGGGLMMVIFWLGNNKI